MSDVVTKDLTTNTLKSISKVNRGQFKEGSKRAREMGRKGGQNSSRRGKNKSTTALMQ